MAEKTLFNGLVSNESKLVFIDVDKIVPNPLNTYLCNDYDELKASISSFGLLHPLTVIGPNAKDEYVIISGERRYRAISDLHKKDPAAFVKVPCYITRGADMDEIEQQLAIETTNLEVRDFNRNEHRLTVIGLLKKLEENGSIDQKEMAHRANMYLKISPRYATMYKTIYSKASEEVKKLLFDDKIPVADAAKFSNLERDQQGQIVDMINNGIDSNKAYQTVVGKKAKSDGPADDSALLDEDRMLEAVIMLGNDGEVDPNSDTFKELFDNRIGKADLNIDTTGRLNTMKQWDEDEENYRYEKAVKNTQKTLRILLKKEATELTNEEYEIINLAAKVASAFGVQA